MSEKRAAEVSASSDADAPPTKKARLSGTGAVATEGMESKSPEKIEIEIKSKSSKTDCKIASKEEELEMEDEDIEINDKRIVFLTGNKGKLMEVKSFFDESIQKLISNKELDLEETQGTPKDIIKAKLLAARKELGTNTNILVEDTSLILRAYSKTIETKSNSNNNNSNNSNNSDSKSKTESNINEMDNKELVGMPGPYVKWLLKWDKDGNEGLCKMVRGLDDNVVFAICIFGFLSKNSKYPMYFEGRCQGVVPPKPLIGKDGFGWDPVFVPKDEKENMQNNDKSFAQMSVNEKNKISHRGEALLKLKKYLENEYLNKKENKKEKEEGKQKEQEKEKEKEKTKDASEK